MKNIFFDVNNAIDQLKRDKHTLLEGYITEYYFEKQFLKGNTNVKYTKGWWMAKNNDVNLFFIVKEKLNDLDNKIKDIIEKNNYCYCWQVILVNDKFKFIRENEILYENQFVNKYDFKLTGSKMQAAEITRNKVIQNKSIDFFKKNNIITEIATERYFANNFLSLYTKDIVNIDCFTKKR